LNLAKLFEMQRQLDERIMEQHPELRGQDNLPWKVLALQVELGELANEWRGFKYWSNNRKARILAYKKCPCGTDYGWCDEYGCEDGLLAYNPLLEEYVDCLHFILSIGLELKAEKYKPFSLKKGNVIEQFIELNMQTCWIFVLNKNENAMHIRKMRGEWYFLIDLFIGLGEMLGFTWEQVEQAYMQKHAENVARQERGY